MVLLGVKAEGPWLISSWKLAYGVGWMNICKAALCMYPDLIDGEILLAGFASPKRAEISCVDDILNFEESNTLIIRGASRLVKARIEVIFHNQLQFIDVCVERNDKFTEADYKNFNKSICQYLDSIEIHMHMAFPDSKA